MRVTITTTLTLNILLDDFDASSFRTRFALLIGVGTERVRAHAEAGSVVATAVVVTEDSAERSAITTTLKGMDPASASAALQVEVETIDVAAQVDEVRSPPPSSPPEHAPFPVAIVVGSTVGVLVVALVTLIVCLLLRRRRQRAPKRTGAHAAPSADWAAPPVVPGTPAQPDRASSPLAKGDQPPAYLRPVPGESAGDVRANDRGQDFSYV